jgi:hypothetical protein
MRTARRPLVRRGILSACVYVSWLVFIDSTHLALNDDKPLLIAVLAVSIAATPIGCGLAVYSTWTK